MGWGFPVSTPFFTSVLCGVRGGTSATTKDTRNRDNTLFFFWVNRKLGTTYFSSENDYRIIDRSRYFIGPTALRRISARFNLLTIFNTSRFGY